jgi:hypothetical protein
MTLPLLDVQRLLRLFCELVAQKGDLLIDATVGNGHDTLFLAELAQKLNGQVIGFDIQQKAIDSTKKRVEGFSNVTLILDSHASFDRYLKPRTVGLIVYNLGYLPCGEKSITTLAGSTLQSIRSGLELLRGDGGIAITCYSGHIEGVKEIEVLKEFLHTLDPKKFYVTWTRWENRNLCPSVVLIQRMERTVHKRG